METILAFLTKWKFYLIGGFVGILILGGLANIISSISTTIPPELDGLEEEDRPLSEKRRKRGRNPTPDVEELELGTPKILQLRKAYVFLDEMGVRWPRGRSVTVCSGNSCAYKHKYTFDSAFLRKIKLQLKSASDSEQERELIAKSLGELETQTGSDTGTGGDSPGSVLGNGNPQEMNHMDKAATVLQYLNLMVKFKMIKYHDVDGKLGQIGSLFHMKKLNVIVDKQTGDRYKIDTVSGEHGEPAIITR